MKDLRDELTSKEKGNASCAGDTSKSLDFTGIKMEAISQLSSPVCFSKNVMPNSYQCELQNNRSYVRGLDSPREFYFWVRWKSLRRWAQQQPKQQTSISSSQWYYQTGNFLNWLQHWNMQVPRESHPWGDSITRLDVGLYACSSCRRSLPHCIQEITTTSDAQCKQATVRFRNWESKNPNLPIIRVSDSHTK